MLVKTQVTNLLMESLSSLNKKQEVISSNISNIDTPGYKAKELNFDDYMNSIDPSKINAKIDTLNKFKLDGLSTNKNHFNLDETIVEPSNITPEVRDVESFLMQNDKNNVDLDKENIKMSKTQLLTSAVLSIYKKESSMFKQVFENSSRLS